MTDFRVSPSALASSADAVADVGTGVSQVASSMTPPPPLMCGMLIAPVLNIFAQVVHIGAQQVVQGIAHEDRMIARNIQATGTGYAEFEDDAVAAIHEFFGSI